MRSRIILSVIFAIELSNSSVSALANVSQSSSNNWLHSVFDEITERFHPSHVTIFTNDPKNENFFLASNILNSIMSNTTTLVINTNGVKANDPIFKLPVFYYPRKSNFYVLFYPTKDLYKTEKSIDTEDLKSVIDLLVNISAKPIRPFFLLVLYGQVSLPARIIESISSYAWSKKVLDFTTLLISRDSVSTTFDHVNYANDHVTYHYYNPFTGKHFADRYSEKALLFPNKIQNLHGYTLKVAATSNPPYTTVERNQTGYPTLNSASPNFRILKILAKHLNFNYDFAPSDFEYYSGGGNESILRRLIDGEINLGMNHFFMKKTVQQFDLLESSSMTAAEHYTALVPVNQDDSVKTPANFIYYVLTTISTFALFYVLAQILKFDKRFWSALKILQILLNMSVTRVPKRWSERYIFFGIIIFSFNLSMNIVREMTSMQFERAESGNNDLELLGKEGFTPAVLERYLDIVLEEVIEKNAEFKARLRTFASPEDCARRLEQGEKFICFMSQFTAESTLQNHLSRNAVPKIKQIDPSLWNAWKHMVFEPGSPYVRAFSRPLRRLRDAGIISHLISEETKKRSLAYTKEEIQDTKIISVEQLKIELLVGYTIATFSLILEIFIYRFKKKDGSRGKIFKCSASK